MASIQITTVISIFCFVTCFRSLNANSLEVAFDGNVIILNWDAYVAPADVEIDGYLVKVNITDGKYETFEVDKTLTNYRVELQPNLQYGILVQANDNGVLYLIGQVFAEGASQDLNGGAAQTSGNNGMTTILIIGSVVGGVIIIITTILVTLCYLRRNASRTADDQQRTGLRPKGSSKQAKEENMYQNQNPFVPVHRGAQGKEGNNNVSRSAKLINPIYQDVSPVPSSFVELPTVYKTDAEDYDTDEQTSHNL